MATAKPDATRIAADNLQAGPMTSEEWYIDTFFCHMGLNPTQPGRATMDCRGRRLQLG